ncbi:MAG: hypothetical protein SFX73_35565 [Kofleriaceae bacterium]|nr:hypothetical protein [Kofleriaceae bacterium]
MRWATFVVATAVLAACNDLRDFRGTWEGPRVGDTPVLRVGAPASATASLTIEELDTAGLVGTLSIDGLVTDARFVSLPGAEADALAGMTFAGSPLRVYLAFVAMPDGGGEALALVALFDDRRIEVRLLRGGSTPLYAIFALASPQAES